MIKCITLQLDEQFKCDNKYFEFSKINITKENGRYTFENFEISTTSEENLIIAIVYKH